MYGTESLISKISFRYAFSFQYLGEGKKVAVPGEIYTWDVPGTCVMSISLNLCKHMHRSSVLASHREDFLGGPDLGRPASLLPALLPASRLLGNVMSPEARPGIG